MMTQRVADRALRLRHRFPRRLLLVEQPAGRREDQKERRGHERDGENACENPTISHASS
jgi:hypothetical protein